MTTVAPTEERPMRFCAECSDCGWSSRDKGATKAASAARCPKCQSWRVVFFEEPGDVSG
jgi:predicted Zn-ribbon and HTH transcriptional regulator